MTNPENDNQSVADNESARVLSQFANIAGLDVDYGLALVRGNKNKYLQVLTLFVNLHAPDLDRIPVLLSENDSSAVKLLTHTMKGSAAMIGATGVAEAAARLHAAIVRAAALTDIEYFGIALCEELGSLIEGIRSGSNTH